MEMTIEEKAALERFYKGERARSIRKDCPNIWQLVAKVRNHPQANELITQFKEVCNE